MPNSVIPIATLLVFAVTALQGTRCSTVDANQTHRVPEDFRTIQAAIDQANSGDQVIVGPGVYFESLQLKSGVIVRSAGDDSPGTIGLKRAEQTILDGKSKRDVAGIVMAPDAVVDGLTLRNWGTFDEDQWTYHHRTQGNEQDHEHIGRRTVAPILINGKACEVRNSIVHHNGYSGIVVDGAASGEATPLIADNICFRNMGAGISLMNGTRARVFRNRCHENFYAGIGQNNASPHLLKNICHGNIRAGIGISNGSCPTVEQNRCYQNRRAGIGCRTGKGTQPVIRGNECFENEMAGIGAEEEAAPIIVENHCYGNRLAGIGCRSHASPTIVGNRCERNGQAGIGCGADSWPLIVDNECTENEAAGIGFAPSENARALVLNNRLRENRLVALGIHAGWKVFAAGNQARRTGGLPPLVMVHQGAEAEFVDNEFSGGGVAGIRCAGRATVRCCRLDGLAVRKSGPPQAGIWCLPGSEVRCEDSTLLNWRHAVSASQSRIQLQRCQLSWTSVPAVYLQSPTAGSEVRDNVVRSNLAEMKIVNLTPSDQLLISGNQLVESATTGDRHESEK